MAEVRFRAMGTDVHIILVGDEAETDDLAGLARARIDDLERRWSRFIDDSELAQLNAAAGNGPQPVTAITFDVIEAAVDAWRRTGGVFDPTVLPSLIAAGYDRSFDLINEERPVQPTMHMPTRAPGCEHIALDRERLTVALPRDVAIDLGGIGKGRAADLLAGELRDRVDGGCINLGGDLRVWGVGPTGESGWGVAVEDNERAGDNLFVVGIDDGAIATSTIAKRRWKTNDGRELHHLIDPRSGEPAATDVRSVTVIAAEATVAEIDAKVVLITADASRTQFPCHVVRGDGGTETVNAFDDYIW